jgi:hypothetical protein
MPNENEEEIKLALNKAAEIVKDLQPEGLREKAFELVFSKLFSLNTSNLSSTQVLEPVLVLSPGDPSSFFEKLQKETGFSVEDLKSIYKIDKNGAIQIVIPLTGKVADKQRILALLYLFASKFGMEKEWVSALEFAKITNSYGINDSHVGKNLSIDKENIRQTGKKRGKEYMLTPNGVIKTKEVLKGIIK